MEKINRAYVQEPTFLSPIDLNYRLSNNEKREFVLSELREAKEALTHYRVVTKDTTKKSR